MNGDVRLLTFTSLYPSAARPRHGIFVETRLQRLLARGGLTACVVAPVPWFPFAGKRWGEYGRVAATPLFEVRSGVEVQHPRYLMLPRIGMRLQPDSLASSGRRAVEQLQRSGSDFDVIDAHYLYPDGVAAAALARWMGLPYVLSARGSDVNVIAQMAAPRKRILHAIEGSAGVIAVSAALKSAMVGLGVEADRITVLRNGVDAEVFRPVDRGAARSELSLPPGNAPVIASVGNLVPEKRHDLALRAVAQIAGAHFVVVGRGSERAQLDRMVRQLGMTGRVSFLDEMSQAQLCKVYAAADVLVLASEREGWPNVLLESAACGTPVVAFSVGGIPEILADRSVGTLVRAPPAAEPLAAAIGALLAAPPSRESVRAAAVRFSWDPILAAQLELYRRVVRSSRPLVRQAAEAVDA
jgi:teichuronic acid biosynthesis glycosyltransferase TuaC